MNMYPQMETPGGTCTPKQKYEWACCSLRQHLFRKASTLSEGFCRNDDIEKITVLFSTKSLVRIVAKTCFLILRKRNNLLYI